MCVRKTRGVLLKELREKYGGVYEFPNLQYKNTHTKVMCFCLKHCHYFWTSPKKLLQGRGCRLCGYERVSASRSNDEEHLLSSLKVIFGETLSIVDYKGSGNPESEFLCHISGETYKTKYSDLLKHANCKCKACREYRKECSEWKTFFGAVFKSRIAHNFEYDYDLEAGFSKRGVFTVICYKHGPFYPYAISHYHLGTRCPSCAVEDRVYVGGYGDKTFYFDVNEEDGQLPGYVYLLKLYTDVGEYLKVGITGRTPDERIKALKYKPYMEDVEIMKAFSSNLLLSSIVEKDIIDKYTDPRDYIPYQDLGGWTETFSISHEEDVLKYFDFVTKNIVIDSTYINEGVEYE